MKKWLFYFIIYLPQLKPSFKQRKMNKWLFIFIFLSNNCSHPSNKGKWTSGWFIFISLSHNFSHPSNKGKWTSGSFILIFFYPQLQPSFKQRNMNLCFCNSKISLFKLQPLLNKGKWPYFFFDSYIFLSHK